MQQKARYNGPRTKRGNYAKSDYVVDSEAGLRLCVAVGVLRSHIYLKKKKVYMDCTRHQNKQRQFGRIRKMNSPHTHKS